MNMKHFLIGWLMGAITLAARGDLQNSPHDLSAGGYGTGNLCRYCHTPHGALLGTPLWNHKLSDAVYTIYQSTSLEAATGQPTGASKLCLSCHDGTVAIADVLSGPSDQQTFIPPSSDLGTDLSDDHPVSFVYSDTLVAQDQQLRSPQSLPPQVKLDQSSELQCTTCHNPHDNSFGDFLVMSNQQSQLCTSCHDMNGWTTSVHANSNASSRLANDTYLQTSQYATVMENGCHNCHRPHTAGGHERLMHFARNEDNCLNCHNGSVARTDLTTELSKSSAHDVRAYDGIHDIGTEKSNFAMHVECEDCHNPHTVSAASDGGAGQPSGALKGVSGITITGSYTPEIQYEYELCFKCHADNPNRITSPITRVFTQTNTRLEFDPGNPSFHPVAGPGTNPNVPSLVPGLTVTSVITCTDCHNSDNPDNIRGPHGSQYPFLLKLNYQTGYQVPESSSNYALCYSCHSRNSILRGESFDDHRKHLMKKTPCSACHDPHGVVQDQAGSNGTHLINFDMSVVSPDPKTGRLEFEDLGTFRGRCYLRCHGKNHSPKSY